MKRYLSLALIVLMLPALLAVPAMADEVDLEYWFNYLDYGYFFDGSNERAIYSSGYTSVYLNNIPNTWFKYIDLIVYTDSTTLNFSKWGDLNPPFTKVDLGNGYYRFYGEIARDFSNQLLFYGWENGSFIKVVSCNVSTQSFATYSKQVTGTVWVGGKGEHSILYPSDNVEDYSVELDNRDSAHTYFTASMSVAGWQTMDYIQVDFLIYSSAIDSIGVTLNGISVPYDINSVETDYRTGSEAVTYAYLLIDVSGLPKAAYDLSIRVSGALAANVWGNFAVTNCVGMVAAEEPSLWTHWFTQVGTWISNQTSAIVSPIVTWGTNIVNTVGSWGQSLLDGINALPDKIAEALQSLFVPSDSAVQNMGQQSEELAQDRFGGAYEGALIIDEFASNLKPQQTTQILTVPVVNLDILGVPFPLGGWEVDLVPDGTEIVVETCKIIIDIIATLAFINGLRNRLERTLER